SVPGSSDCECRCCCWWSDDCCSDIQPHLGPPRWPCSSGACRDAIAAWFCSFASVDTAETWCGRSSSSLQRSALDRSLFVPVATTAGRSLMVRTTDPWLVIRDALEWIDERMARCRRTLGRLVSPYLSRSRRDHTLKDC